MYTRSKKLLYYCHILVPLSAGLFIYLIYRPEAWITRLFAKINIITISAIPQNIFEKFVCNYGGDLLWAHSLTFFIAYFLPNRKEKGIAVLLICMAVEVSFEVSQLLVSSMHGTFDVIDIFLEVLTSIIIVFRLFNKTKSAQR